MADTSGKIPDLSVVLPVYNGASFIGETVAELGVFFSQTGLDGEALVVDDGSDDGTAQEVREDRDVRVIRLPRNMGKGAALRAGMAESRGKIVAFTDADLPYGTEPLGVACNYIAARRFHAVMGDRTLPASSYEHVGAARQAASALAGFTFRTLLTGGVYDTQCGLKAFRGDVAREVFALTRINGFAIDVEVIYLLLKYRLDIKRIPVHLLHNAPSTVHVFRDSAQAALDIARMRMNWARGYYASVGLGETAKNDYDRDVAEFHR